MGVKEDGIQFLQENLKRDGVESTASGLQYEVIEQGSGASPSETDTVRVNYKGTFIDGSSFDANDGIEFPLNRVISGWTEGLQLMAEGATYKFYIPYNLAYGESGAGGGLIPGYSTLIFEVKLLQVK